MKHKIVAIFLTATFLAGCAGSSDSVSDTHRGETSVSLSVAAASSLVKYDKGYYLASGGLVFYYQPENGEAIPLCNKADCTHGRDSVSKGIYAMRTDGSGSDKVTDLYTYEDSYDGVNVGYLNYIYENGYCYYSHAAYDEDGTYRLYLMRVELTKNAKPEVFFELPCDGMLMDVLGMTASKEIIACTCLNEEGDYVSYVIDSSTAAVAAELEKTLRVYQKEDRLYYLVQGEGVYTMALGENQGSCLIPVEKENLLPGMDDDYIYLDWSRSAGIEGDTEAEAFVEVYTHDGKKVGSVDTGFIGETLNRAYMASDSEYVFFGEAQLYYNDIYVISKAGLFEEEPEWKTIPISQWRPRDNST